MATASQIRLSPAEAGVCHADGVTSDAARKASELLQENHENNHDIFSMKGFHSTLRRTVVETHFLCALTPTPAERQ